jgi:hypothetical protein
MIHACHVSDCCWLDFQLLACDAPGPSVFIHAYDGLKTSIDSQNICALPLGGTAKESVACASRITAQRVPAQCSGSSSNKKSQGNVCAYVTAASVYITAVAASCESLYQQMNQE